MQLMKPQLLITFVLGVFFLGCSSKDSDEAVDTAKEKESKPVVFVPISPYQFIFEKIAGDLIDIKVIVGEGMIPFLFSDT